MTIAHDALSATADELAPAQARQLFERRCHEELGVSGEAFLAAHDADDYPEEWDIAAVSRVEFLIPFAR